MKRVNHVDNLLEGGRSLSEKGEQGPGFGQGAHLIWQPIDQLLEVQHVRQTKHCVCAWPLG